MQLDSNSQLAPLAFDQYTFRLETHVFGRLFVTTAMSATKSPTPETVILDDDVEEPVRLFVSFVFLLPDPHSRLYDDDIVLLFDRSRK